MINASRSPRLLFSIFLKPGDSGSANLVFKGLPSAGVGFVSLFGLSVMARVLLISAINRERTLDNKQLKLTICKASTGQFRSILMMLIVAIIGLIPAAKSSGIGSDIQRPLATVIIGGLTSTLLFTPFLLTALYYWIEKKKDQVK